MAYSFCSSVTCSQVWSLPPWYLWICCRAFYCHAIISAEQEWWSSIKRQETNPLGDVGGLLLFLWAAAEVNYFMAVSVTVTQPAGTSRKKNNKKTHRSRAQGDKWNYCMCFPFNRIHTMKKKIYMSICFLSPLIPQADLWGAGTSPTGQSHDWGTHNHCLLHSHLLPVSLEWSGWNPHRETRLRIKHVNLLDVRRQC